VISWDKSVPEFKIDFGDVAEDYTGILDVTLTGSTVSGDSQDVSFVVQNLGVCATAANTVGITSTTPIEHILFDGITTITWTTSRTIATCDEDLTFKIEIGEDPDNDSVYTYSELTSSVLGTTGSFGLYADNTQLQFSLLELTSTNGFTIYEALRATYMFKIYVYNSYMGATAINVDAS